jgi:hypothetical protein
LLVAVILLSDKAPVQGETEEAQPSDIKTEKPLAAPNLADLVPAATELSRRRELLAKRIADELNVSAVENSYDEIVAKLETYSTGLQKLKEEALRYGELVEIKASILAEAASLQALSEPLAQAIQQIESLRREWLAEKRKWGEWKIVLLEEEPLEEVKLIFKQTRQSTRR